MDAKGKSNLNEPGTIFGGALQFYEERKNQLPYYYRKLEKYLEFFKDRKGVLELGCGQGDFLYLMKEAGVHAEGVDLDPSCVKSCVTRGLKVRRQDALIAVGHLGKSLDAVFCSNVVEHLSTLQLESLFDRIAEELPAGGKLGINTANPEALGIHADSFWRDLTHVRMYPASLLRSMLEARGFEILVADADEDTRSQLLPVVIARMLRTAIFGNFFGPPEICVIGIKKDI
jgi:SAM-dependent methyltransferase